MSFDPSYGQGDATITVTVAANRTLDERTATISAYVIKGENVTLPVTQAAASASDLATHYYVKTDGSADKDGLTWETATTLANAIDQAMNGDVIHVAAGSYVPSVPLTGMKTALDNTFEIHSNFSMIGGYPADAAEGAVADPVANETILDGDHAVCHVVAVTAAKMNGMKASLDGFTIKNGSSQFSTVGSTTIGGVKFYQSYGAGIFIGNATVDILNCKIVDNTDIRMAPSVSTPEPRRCSTTAWLPTMRPSRRRHTTAAVCGPTEPNCCGSTTVRSTTTRPRASVSACISSATRAARPMC